MTNNKQMVSVPREALDVLCRIYENSPYISWAPIRAALAAPAEDVRAMVDEPVAVMYPDGTVLNKAECGNSFDVCCRVNTPLYRQPQRIPTQLFPVKPVLPHPPRHTGFLQPDREVPGYTVEQMKEYGAACVAAFAKQNGDQS